MSELEYFKSQPDYEEFAPHLKLENNEFENTYTSSAFAADFSNALVVDGLPLVGQDKRAKLIGILFKLYTQFAPYLKEEDISMPSDDKGMSMGFCFVKFNNSEDAQQALTKTQGFALGKTNNFIVSLYSDLDKYKTVSDYVAPEFPEFTPPMFHSSWLCDPSGRDQFVVRHGKETEIYWGNTAVGEEPNKVYGGEREKEGGKVWCERQVAFSPRGSYFVTFHIQGIKLWGGDNFESLGRFLHANVETMEFSPCERYIITYSSDPKAAPGTKPENIIIWSVATGQKLRAFDYKKPLDLKMQCNAIVNEEAKGGKRVDRQFRGKVSAYDARRDTYSVSEGSQVHHGIASERVQALQNPNKLKWSHDGRYIARLGADIISVYDMSTMQLLDNKSFLAKDMLNFSWSPNANMLSYWSPTSGNYPAMINIVSVPDRVDICSRKCFDVLEGHMTWQSEGDYLCVHMTKQQSKKRSYVVMLFRVREAGVPVELIELTDPIVHVAWEPLGNRISIVHGESKNATVSFYSMTGATAVAASSSSAKGAKELALYSTVSNQPCTEVNWSPAGGICAIAHLATGDTGTFNFYDVDSSLTLSTRKHERCTGLYWDPSGRMLASVTSSTMINGNIVRSAPLQVEDTYNLWSFQGTPICLIRKEKLYKFMWRPRPALLTVAERHAVVKNLKKYEKIFEREDKIRKAEIHQEATAKRNAIAADFLALLASRKEEMAQKYRGNSWKVVVRDGYDEDDDSNYEIGFKMEEVVISSKEQVITN